MQTTYGDISRIQNTKEKSIYILTTSVNEYFHLCVLPGLAGKPTKCLYLSNQYQYDFMVRQP
jgi:hypothetical protein